MRRAAVLLAAAPLLLAACGGGSSSSKQVQLAPVAYVKQAAKKSAQAASEHVDLKATATVQGSPFGLNGSGDFDNAKKTGAMTVHANVQGLDVQRLGKSQGVDLSALLAQNPTQTFSQLQSSGHVTKVGDETIDGTDTTHYRGRLDLTKLKQFAGATAQPYDVWIGKDDGYVHRIETGFSAGQQSITTTMDFSDFGKDVTVTVPPQSETFEATAKSLDQLGG